MTQPARLVPKWVAWLHKPFNHHEKKIRTVMVHVIETAKQFKLVAETPEEKEARAACGYRSLINKATNDCLFDSELDALLALEHKFDLKERNATKAAEEAQENLYLVSEALACKGHKC